MAVRALTPGADPRGERAPSEQAAALRSRACRKGSSQALAETADTARAGHSVGSQEATLPAMKLPRRASRGTGLDGAGNSWEKLSKP